MKKESTPVIIGLITSLAIFFIAVYCGVIALIVVTPFVFICGIVISSVITDFKEKHRKAKSNLYSVVHTQNGIEHWPHKSNEDSTAKTAEYGWQYWEEQRNTNVNNYSVYDDSTDDGYEQFVINGERSVYECNQTKAASQPKPCSVYLMHDGRSYKIGIANDVDRRLKELRTGNPFIKLVTYKEFPKRSMAEATEKDLHRKYEYRNVGLEWFDLDHDEYEYVKILLS